MVSALSDSALGVLEWVLALVLEWVLTSAAAMVTPEEYNSSPLEDCTEAVADGVMVDDATVVGEKVVVAAVDYTGHGGDAAAAL